MEVVLNKLEKTVICASEEENKTSFDGLYKNWGKLGSQDERRKEILGVQKSNRNSKLDRYRGILELVQAVEEDKIFKTSNKAYYKPSIYVAGFNKVPSYSQVLMMSEWMIEKPCDFEENWFVVPSPKGIRVLLVANNGNTRLFTKYGHTLCECRTALPGGNPCGPKTKTNCCVLDCFYQKKGNLLYVLDILAWNSQPMTDGELEFRDYWLRSQFLELNGLTTISKNNELIFRLLPKVSCAPESFRKFMMEVHLDKDPTCLDGLLFFHKQAHYFSGETPLVGWLYPFMVPEILGNDITVNQVYMIQKPEGYMNQAAFIVEFNRKLEKKSKARSKRRSTSQSMDTTDVSQTEIRAEESESQSQSKDKTNNETMEEEVAPEIIDKPKNLTMEAEIATHIIDKTEMLGAMDTENIKEEKE